jgi:putative transposase
VKIIRACFKASNGIYGSPTVLLELREAGDTCGKPKPGAKPSGLVPNVLQRQLDVGRPKKAIIHSEKKIYKNR